MLIVIRLHSDYSPALYLQAVHQAGVPCCCCCCCSVPASSAPGWSALLLLLLHCTCKPCTRLECPAAALYLQAVHQARVPCCCCCCTVPASSAPDQTALLLQLLHCTCFRTRQQARARAAGLPHPPKCVLCSLPAAPSQTRAPPSRRSSTPVRPPGTRRWPPPTPDVQGQAHRSGASTHGACIEHAIHTW